MPVGSRNSTDMTLLVFIANNAFSPQSCAIWMERRHRGKDIDHYCSTDVGSL